MQPPTATPAADTPLLSRSEVERYSFNANAPMLGASRIVAYAVSVRVDIRNGERTGGGVVPIHEIPLMKRKYPEGSEIKIDTTWPAAVDRCMPLAQDALKGTDNPNEGEFNRLIAAYTIPLQGGGKRELVKEIFGGDSPEAQLVNLTRKLREVAEAWARLEAELVQRVCAAQPAQAEERRAAYEKRARLTDLMVRRNADRTIPISREDFHLWYVAQELHSLCAKVVKVEELEALVAIVEPFKKAGVQHIDLPEVALPDAAALLAQAGKQPAASGEGAPLGEDAGDGDPADGDAWFDRLLAALKEAKVPERTALEVAALAEERGEALTDEELAATSEGWMADRKYAAKRIAKVRKLLAAFPRPATAESPKA